MPVPPSRSGAMHWQVKALTQKTLSIVPGGGQVYRLLQRRCGGLRRFEHECEGKIQDWKNMAGLLQRAGLRLQGSTVLEIGAGWYPTLPLCTYLAGAREVITVDLVRHLEPDLTVRCTRQMQPHLEEIARFGGRDTYTVNGAHTFLLESLRAGDGLAEATRGVITYLAPADATSTALAPDSVDVVFSNSVLEHVPPIEVANMMRESFRILRSGGLMFHSINCGDHYSYVDPSITQLNYLQFTESQWRIWNNKFLYQNRLRAVDFTRCAVAAGFEIVINTAQPTAERRLELQAIPLADCFRAYPPDELCITTIDFVARKPGGGGDEMRRRDKLAADPQRQA